MFEDFDLNLVFQTYQGGMYDSFITCRPIKVAVNIRFWIRNPNVGSKHAQIGSPEGKVRKSNVNMFFAI